MAGNQSNLQLTVDAPSPPALTNQQRGESLHAILRGHEEYIINLHGAIISSNLEAVNISGYDEWEIIGKHFSIFYTDEEIQNGIPEQNLITAQQRGKFVTKSWKLKRKRIKYMAEMSIQPILNTLNSVTAYKLILKDLTYKEVYDLKYNRLHEEYTFLFQNSFIGILKFNLTDGKVLLINDKAEQILGVKKGDNLQKAFSKNNTYHELNKLLSENGMVSGYEFETHSGTSDPKWISIDCKDIGSDGIVECIVCDISTRIAQQEEVSRLNHELDAFIYHSSHDLRSPLSSILGLINLLKLAKPPKQVKVYADMIEERVLHLTEVLRDLSIIAFNNKSQMIYERVYFAEEISAILQDMNTPGLTVKSYLNISDAVPFYTDIVRIRIIFKNLISNAIKFANKMATNQFVKISVTTDTQKATISVEDNGIGIDNAQIVEIYNLFYRGSNYSNGAGLGLYIVKQILEKLNGSIHVQSRLGKGTTFKVEIPNTNTDVHDNVS